MINNLNRTEQNRTEQNRTEQNRTDSSFFQISYSGKRVLVLAPHQDDELNVAAVSIQNFIRQGAEVFAAFSTNGDYSLSADIRLKEAADSLAVLGLDRSHIFILGYGDTFNDKKLNAESGYKFTHIFYSEDNVVISSQGRTETYGAAGLQDFAYLTRKEHSKYCRRDYLRDLRELILYVKPDIILAVDFDSHSDHRMLSLSFETVMGSILSRPGNDYHPEVFKRFAYSTAWKNAKDFFADNLKETQKPSDRMIDISCYSWSERVRIPVPENCRYTLLEGNMTAKALRQHESQSAIFHAASVINSDEVFFKRRTDSIAYSAKVSASSGHAEYVNDFMLLNVNDIYSETPEWTNYLWIPDSNDEDKILTFKWESGQKISFLRIWGNVDGEPVRRIKISMNTGYESEYGSLPEHGLPLEIRIPEQSNVTEMNIKIIDQGSSESGLAEVEIFEREEQEPVLMPFIQITSSGNFIYDYSRKPQEKIIPIECYSYHVSSPVHYDVEGPAHFDGVNLVFDGDDDVILRAYIEGSNIFCRSVFHTVSSREFKRLHSRQKNEQRMLKIERFCSKYRHRIKKYTDMLREKGLIYEVKYIVRKVIEKLKKK